MTLEQLLAKKAALRVQMQVIIDGAKADGDRAMNDEESAKFAKLTEERGKINREIESKQEFERQNTLDDAAMPRISNPRTIVDSGVTVDQMPRMYGRCRFMLDDKRQGGLTAEQKAYRFGIWGYAMCGVRWAQEKMRTMNFYPDNYKVMGVPVNMHGEDSDIAGGLFVPPEFEWDIITLREVFGVFRRNTRVVPMARDTKSIPRRVSGLTAYPVGEGQAITASSKAWNMVKLIAKKVGAIVVMSNELDEDAVMNFGDDLVGEIAYAFAYFEDQCGFIGDSTSTYHGIIGAANKVQNPLNAASLPAVSAVSGLVQGTGSGAVWTGILLTDFQSVIGKLPQYADTPNAKWYMHKTFYETVCKRLALAAGGVTGNEIMNGVRQQQFLGYPVEFSQIMPKVAVLKATACLLGDLKLASKMGDRRALTLARSTDASLTDERGATVSLFTQDAMAIRGTERIDINNHDYGDTNTTAASQNPGPVIGLVAPQS